MTGLLLALSAALLAGIGARDQTAMARLAGAQGARPSAWVIGIAIACATAAVAAWAALAITPLLPVSGPALLAGLAIALAGAEMLAIVPGPAPKEPTNSLGALAFVLIAHQLTDATRLLTFAIALLAASPVLAGVGGALGGTLSLSAAWLAPQVFGNARLRVWRKIVGAVLLATAAVWLLAL